jgi:predicted DNA-binding protein
MSKEKVLIFTAIRLPQDLRKDADQLAKRHSNLSVVLIEAISLGLLIIKKADLYKDGLVLVKSKELRGK